MTDITIPPEALEAAELVAENFGTMKECCISMLRSWPGMHMGHQCVGCGGDPQIILPLPQEASDE